MKQKKYIKPDIKMVETPELMQQMLETSWGVDGTHQPIGEAEGDDIEVFSKKNNLWEEWE